MSKKRGMSQDSEQKEMREKRVGGEASFVNK